MGPKFFSGDPFVQLWYFNGSQGDQVLEGPKSKAKLKRQNQTNKKETTKKHHRDPHFESTKNHDIFFHVDHAKALLTKSVKELSVFVLSLAFFNQWD